MAQAPLDEKQGDADGKFRVSAPQLSLPKGGGAIRGIGEKFTANAVTGTGSMSVPIATSPGRSGFGPSLSLGYDSGQGNSPFGLGWHLSLPSITRKTDKGLPRYVDDEDVYILSGSEDLVPLLVLNSGAWVPEDVPDQTLGANEYAIKRYRPRVEGLFARIERWSNKTDRSDVFWRSISKDNVSTWYGQSSNSRIADPKDSSRIFSWLICESHDNKGNAIVYEYAVEDRRGVDGSRPCEIARGADPTASGANRYIKYIRYGNAVSLLAQPDVSKADWLFEVVFDYGEGHYLEEAPDADANIYADASPSAAVNAIWPARLDAFSSRRSGFEMRTYRLCQRVLMFHHFDELTSQSGPNYLVRSTEFEYHASPIATTLVSISQCGFAWKQNNLAFLKRSIPALLFTYSSIPTDEELIASPILVPDRASLENLPIGLNGTNFIWADLRGEGISGIIVETQDSIGFKPNWGKGAFGPLQNLIYMPSLGAFGAKHTWQDITGSGELDLAVADGFYQPLEPDKWTFRHFEHRATVDLQRPDVHLSDQTGDGLSDIVIIEGERCTVHRSLGEAGFAPATHAWMTQEQLPEQPLYLSDFTGDGLPDQVSIRNGCVLYRPSLGFGRFGAPIVMDNSPWFDTMEGFDPRRIRLADLDGSGTTDILYLSASGVKIFSNQSGNGWSDAVVLPQFQCVDPLDDLSVIDLLGRGTACLVWSSVLPSHAQRQMSYIDLMGGQKPHLLTQVVNNLGAETKITYASSTQFFLEDQRNGNPWITKLPFPVQVVERIETFDQVSRNYFLTRYAYHHGFFDGAPTEREFRGFGMVEQWDTEVLAALAQSNVLPASSNLAAAISVPSIYTKTWYHTGVYIGGNRVSNYYAQLLSPRKVDEYFREPGLTDAQANSLLLADTLLPTNLSVADDREACRALKGFMLRQEVYALDESSNQGLPYKVIEQNLGVELLQPIVDGQHGAFFTHPRETLSYQYERTVVPVIAGQIVAEGGNTAGATWEVDPRITHTFTLKVDDFGNVLRSATVNYGRRFNAADSELLAADKERQRLIQVVVNTATFTNAVLTLPDSYRVSQPAETITWELRQATQQQSGEGLTVLMKFDTLNQAIDQAGDGSHDIAYEDINFSAAAHAVLLDPSQESAYFRRPIEHLRTLYRPDDFGMSVNDANALLPLGTLEPLALAGEAYKLAFTPGLLTQIYQRGGQPLLVPTLEAVLAPATDGGGYISSQQAKVAGQFPPTDPDGFWWVPSGRAFCSPKVGDTATQENAYATQHFYLPLRVRDPFGFTSLATLDDYDLLQVQGEDAAGNRVTAGERLLGSDLINPAVPGNDYRVLAPCQVMDANRNRTQAVFDALGMVVGTAVRGKPEENLGDNLIAFKADLTKAELLQHIATPLTNPGAILANASTRLLYDLFAYQRSIGQAGGAQAACVYSMARETHLNDEGGMPSKIQHVLSYSDGFGREIQRKSQAAPDFTGGVAGPPRWISSGWTVFNRSKPVLKYEPAFSTTPVFEFATASGIGPIIFYDALDRPFVTLYPNHSYDKAIYTPWKQLKYDANDTCAPHASQTGDPRTDPDVKGELTRYFSDLPPAVAAAWRTWYQQRNGNLLGPLEQQAAKQAADHADTPEAAHLDSMGRPFLKVIDNRVVCPGHPLDGTESFFVSRNLQDIEGNERQVFDALQREVMRSDFDMLGNRIHQSSMEAGERWMLGDVTGKSIRGWDDRGHNFSSNYDSLRRPVAQLLLGTSNQSDARTTKGLIQYEKIEYGESLLNAELLNCRSRIFRHSDTAGVITNQAVNPLSGALVAYDFKGNLLRSVRELVSDYTLLPDWSNPPALTGESFSASFRFDALNRTIQSIAPHSNQAGTMLNVIQHGFNEANLLQSVGVWLGRAGEPAALIDPAATAPSTVGVKRIDYDEKNLRTSILYVNNVGTSYVYDRLTYRLTQLLTQRPTTVFPNDCPQPPPIGWPGCQIQNLNYTYDPIGNITHIQDNAQQKIFFRNRFVEPSSDYVYDSQYRLIQAAGREHLGQNGAPVPYSYNDAPNVGIQWSANDGQIMGRYTEQYVYDGVGNFTELTHSRTDAAAPSWTRTYQYKEVSQLDATAMSNRLTSTQVNALPTEQYSVSGNGYDAHGNMLKMPQLQVMQWDFLNRLLMTQRQKVNSDDSEGGKHQGELTYYVYDASGERVRKITEKPAGTVKDERFYLGAFEVFRKNGVTPLARETLHVMDDRQRIALVETRTTPTTSANDPSQLIRYQFSDHLGSAALELTDTADIVSFEIFTPYGDTAYQAVGGQTIAPKRYRFTGKERDEQSGLSYHSGRYYSPWLTKWISCDPHSIEGGVNLYEYAKSSPSKYVDLNGNDPLEWLHAQLDAHHDGYEAFAQQSYKESNYLAFANAKLERYVGDVVQFFTPTTEDVVVMQSIGPIGPVLSPFEGAARKTLESRPVRALASFGERHWATIERFGGRALSGANTSIRGIGRFLEQKVGDAIRGLGFGGAPKDALERVENNLASRDPKINLPAKVAAEFRDLLVDFERQFANKSAEKSDVELKKVIIEVTAGGGTGKEKQIKSLLSNAARNPGGKPVILFGPKIGPHVRSNVQKLDGAIVAKTWDELRNLVRSGLKWGNPAK